MIKRRDVVRVKMPFPNISSDLAAKAHMYLCHQIEGSTVRFVKCQTLKPYMLSSMVMKHYWDEAPDVERNPFVKKTRINCDKEFVTRNVWYDDGLKTTIRPDVCEDTMLHVDAELMCDGYETREIEESELLQLNPLAYRVFQDMNN